jgi:hypothetical protein
VLPAPAAVPVERLVGNGLVGPLTLRPVSGVCERSRSRPVPPALSLVEGPLRAGVFLRPGRAFDPDAARRFGRELAAAFFRVVRLFVLRDVLAERLRLLADDRALARLFAEDRFPPLLERFRAAPAVFRFAAFFAMVVDLASWKRAQDRRRPPWTLTGGL